MKRILLSLSAISAAALIVIIGTSAFFTDQEVSTGNVLAAGTIDLMVGNDAYYSQGAPLASTWQLSDLTIQKFFYYLDLKPGDWGTNSIELQVNTNPAWVCADLEFTNEEVLAADQALAEELRVVMWNDVNGNNRLDQGESVFQNGLVSDIFAAGGTLTIADTSANILGMGVGSPMPANTTINIGQGFCYGDITLAPEDPNDTNLPDHRRGFTCNGTQVDNDSQGGKVMADFTFRAVQSRNNDQFVCSVEEVQEPVVTAGAWNATNAAGARWKGTNSGGEFFLGVADLGVGGNRVETNYTWADGIYDVQFSYDSIENKISASVTSPTSSLNYDFDDLNSPACSVANWNTMQIGVYQRTAGTLVAFEDATLNTNNLGDFPEDANLSAGSFWTISNFDFSQDWTIAGKLNITNFGNNENNKLELSVGCAV